MASAQGKTAIITGAAGGLGKAIAGAFLAAGANVVICDVHAQRIAAVLVTQTDVTDEAAVVALVAAAVAKFGRVDVLVNNAAIMDDFAPVGDCSKARFQVLNINLNGPYLTSKAAVGYFRGFTSGAAYTVSKAGVMALTKNTAGYYGPKGIYAVALLLGAMEGTNIRDAFSQTLHMDMFQRVQASQTPFVPSQAAVPVAAVAKYCLFLTDADIAAGANGSCVVFNGNWPEA
ncbi:hypothetical protein B0T26DRAFT_736672 [Lasiosphaeria miniovina]|uniref:Uncharacterized protein n=1 Tax=Lasiosphaeria miniovina TaxID=1954250 RepID=A0AA40BGK3_9PEZI|nr:uncharacterized protein B0T26DRAFT_736672 [Lasiosphaeria miniovina]KAK0733840.1 hypothetical protein B0T26DRAFT_736672 [Lasiosphaeria miniovina]